MSQSSNPQQSDPVRSSLFSGVIAIALIASVVGLSANSIRDRGSINLNRNYFKKLPAVTNTTEQVQPTIDSETGDVTAVTPTPDDGIQRLSFEEAQDNFIVGEEEFESTGESIYIFVDARVRDQYEEGHIPGAAWLYHYESENLIDELRSELEMAFFVIVYCNGGDCEDSIHLATDLTSLYGLPAENIFVYEGGLNEWKEREMPVTVGPERR